MILNMCRNLLNISFIKRFSNNKFVSSFLRISSIIKGKLSHYSITQLNIKNMIILSSLKKSITFIMFYISLSLTATRIYYISNFFPFLISTFPHISFCILLIFKNFDFSFLFTFYLT